MMEAKETLYTHLVNLLTNNLLLILGEFNLPATYPNSFQDVVLLHPGELLLDITFVGG
jgi:hypothetical protein